MELTSVILATTLAAKAFLGISAMRDKFSVNAGSDTRVLTNE